MNEYLIPTFLYGLLIEILSYLLLNKGYFKEKDDFVTDSGNLSHVAWRVQAEPYDGQPWAAMNT